MKYLLSYSELDKADRLNNANYRASNKLSLN